MNPSPSPSPGESENEAHAPWETDLNRDRQTESVVMADPLTKRKTGVFEDFPLPERKHFDAHRAARGSLGAGFAPMDEEKRAFAHLKRDNVRKDSHGR